MALTNANDVAKRSLCLELLLQRLGLEIDEEDPVAERDAVRRAWVSRLGQLGLEEAILADERALLERSVGELTDDECDDIEGRVIGALVLLWSLSRLGARPTAAILGIATRLIAEHGVLGDGSIPEAKAAIASVALRPEPELREARAAYAAAQAAAEATDPEAMVSAIGVRALDGVLGEAR
ncbi:MAG TPA: hypothetical protein VLT33_16085 [Labilithrix sp.]|nr:hypothetical protein [Labilithrix sp.]